MKLVLNAHSTNPDNCADIDYLFIEVGPVEAAALLEKIRIFKSLELKYLYKMVFWGIPGRSAWFAYGSGDVEDAITLDDIGEERLVVLEGEDQIRRATDDFEVPQALINAAGRTEMETTEVIRIGDEFCVEFRAHAKHSPLEIYTERLSETLLKEIANAPVSR